MFRKKKPRRLYIPAKSRWYKRPRRKTNTVSGRGKKKVFWQIIQFFKNRVALLLGAIGGLLLIVVLFSSTYFSIKNIEVLRGDFYIDSVAIESKLKHFIGTNMFFFVDNRIRHAIQNDFPEFATVNVQKIFPNQIKISLESHANIANLKAYYILPESQELHLQSSYGFNETAQPSDAEQKAVALPPVATADPFDTVFSLNPQEKQTSNPIEQKGLINRIGQAIFDQTEDLELITIMITGLTQPIEDRTQIITSEHMKFIIESVPYFNTAMNMEIVGLEYLSTAREIHLKTKAGLIIWITLEKSYQEQIDRFKTIYEPAELNTEDLSYIDLRIREKVIYCPKNAACSR
jgi:hypothetical protein